MWKRSSEGVLKGGKTESLVSQRWSCGWEKEMCENIASHSKMHKSLRDQSSTRCPARKLSITIRHFPYDPENLFMEYSNLFPRNIQKNIFRNFPGNLPKKLPKKSQHMKNVSKKSWKKSSNCRYSFQHSCFCLPPTLKNIGGNIFFLISFVLRFDQIKKVTNIAEKTKDWLLVAEVSFSKIFISHSILFI